VRRISTRTKIAVGVVMLALAFAVALTRSLQTEPTVTVDLLSYTNGRVTVQLINNGRVPLVCQDVPTGWILDEGPTSPLVCRLRSRPVPFSLEAGAKRQVVAKTWWHEPNSGDGAPGELGVMYRPVRGALRTRIEQLLSQAGFRVTNRWFLVSVDLPPRKP
jgi:hypothetical protein